MWSSHAQLKSLFGGSVVKNLPANAGDTSSVRGSGRSPGEGEGYPLQYSGLEDSMGCKVHGVAKSRIRLSDFHFTLFWEYLLRVFLDE